MLVRRTRLTQTAVLAAVLIIVFSAPACSVEFDYDIFIQNDSLAVWIDVTPVLTQPRLEDLLAGLDIYLGLDLSLEVKGAFGLYRSEVRQKSAIVISHKLIDDIYRLNIVDRDRSEYSFDNLLQLKQFMSDSLVFILSDKSSLDQEKSFRLSFDLMAKSGSNGLLGIRSGNSLEPDERSVEIKFLEGAFSQFLKIIGFGRSAYHVDSPRFIIKELPNSSQ